MNVNINNKFIDKFFRPVDNVCWDLLSGNVGYSSNEGVTTINLGDLNDDKTEALTPQVSINPIEQFGISIPAFAQSTPVDSIKLGDMIFSSSTNKILGWVVKKNEKSFKLMKADGTKSDWSPPHVSLMGLDSGVMVLRSLMNMLPGGSSGLSSMQSSLMPMLAMGMLGEGSNGLDLKGIMPIMLMSQMGMGTVDTSSANPMANMMPMLMMMQMMGGKSSNIGKASNFFDR